MIEKWGGGVAARSSLFSSLQSSCLRLLACRRCVGLLAGGRTTLHAASGRDAAGKNCNLPVDNHICRIEFLEAEPSCCWLRLEKRTPNVKVSSMHYHARKKEVT